MIALLPASLLAALAVGGAGRAPSPAVVAVDLVGEPTAGYPYFRRVQAVQESRPVRIAVDPTRHPNWVGASADVWVVPAKSQAEWDVDATLHDARSGPTPLVVQPGSIAANVVTLDGGTLPSYARTDFGVGFDVVLDFDHDGVLSDGDAIDGAGDEDGFSIVPDPTRDGVLKVAVADYSGGTFLQQRVHYPARIASLGKLPLVVISHGNGHNYKWYGHIGTHLASWGCIVMSHRNNTMPGPEAASVTTLSNTEYILANQDTIAGGVLDGHIDASRIVWIGHSRGGEGVVRAHGKLVSGEYVPQTFTPQGVRLLCSLAPTEFLISSLITPHEVPYALFVGASDTDVLGGPSSVIAQSFPIFERATGEKLCVSIHGAGHGDFHDKTGVGCFCTGPDLIGKTGTHATLRNYVLPLVKRYAQDSPAARAFLERSYDDLHGLGMPSNVELSAEFAVARSSPRLVVDDFQTQPDLFVSSSGGAVSGTVSGWSEGLMEDHDGSFDSFPAVPLNGMTRWRDAGDDPQCAVFDWSPGTGPQHLRFELPDGSRDLTAQRWLAFRAGQGTRHPQTVALDGPLSFGVSLVDGAGHVSTVPVAEFGRLPRPYLRTGFGSGAGWANELVSLRIDLEAFTHDRPDFDLGDVVALRFEFGLAFGAERGRIGLDDVQFLPGP